VERTVDLVDRLLAADPWVELVARRDLLDELPGGELRARIAGDPRVAALLEGLDPWPPLTPMKAAVDQRTPLTRLGVLADLGLDRSEQRVARLAETALASIAADGTFPHGGFEHTKAYDARGYVCVTHEVTAAVARFGYAEDPRLRPAIEHLRRTERLDGGWRPSAARLPGTRGEADPSCPFGTVSVLRAATAVGGAMMEPVMGRAAHFLLTAWSRRAEPWRPVGFGMGSTFAKLAYPFGTYGILRVLDALAEVTSVRDDPRLTEMLAFVEAKGGPNGWHAEFVSGAWSAFDFGQKREPSPWITALVLRARRRISGTID
jgi:hypothetical protein